MGLNDNTKNIEIALKEKNRIAKQKEKERKIKELQKQREKEKKEDFKRLEKEIQQALGNEFEKYFEIAGAEYVTYFYSIERRTELQNTFIKKFGINEIRGNDKQGYLMATINKTEIIDIFNKNYYKILKQKENEYKLNDKYKYLQLLEEAEREEQEKAKQPETTIEKFNRQAKAAEKIAKIILFIAFFPITIILLVVFGTCKQAK